jgi:hypothetical protein
MSGFVEQASLATTDGKRSARCPRNRHVPGCRADPGLPGLLVNRMLVAEPAELLVLDAAGLLLLVLCRRVVSAFAIGAFKRDNISHRQTFSFFILRLTLELATGIEPVTSSLPRKCSTN